MADGSWKKENLLLGEKSVLMLRRERRIGIRSQEAVTTAMGSVCVVIDGDVGSFRDGTVIAPVLVEFRSFVKISSKGVSPSGKIFTSS